MKTMRKLFMLGLTLAFVLSACNKDEGNGGMGIDVPDYTDKSVEETKTDLEKDGQALVTTIEDLSTEPAVEVMGSMPSTTYSETTTSSVVTKSLSTLSGANEGEVKNHISASLKSFTETESSIEDDFADAAGTYTWNFDSQSWDYTASPSDEIIYEFPGDTTTTTNNATLTINNVSAEEISDPMWDDYSGSTESSGDMLTSAEATLEYEGSTVATLTYSASVQANGLPSNVTLSLELGEFTFSTELNHTENTNLNLTYNISHNDETILELYGEVSGNWSEESIENNTETKEEEYNGQTYTYEEVQYEEIVRNANAHYQVMNAKILGAVDFKKLGDRIKQIEDDESMTQEEEVEAMTEAMNNHTTIALVYADGSGKIADATFYVELSEEEWCYQDYETGEEICESETYPGVNLIFADESEVDAEVYFSDVFGESIDEFNDLMSDLADQYNY